MRWLDSITNLMDMNLSRRRQMVEDREAWLAAVHGVAKSQIWLKDWTIALLITSTMLFNRSLEFVNLAWLNSIPAEGQLPIPHSTIPWHTPFYFLLLWVWVFKLFHINIIESDYDQLISLGMMASRFIHIVTKDTISFLFMADAIVYLSYHIFFIHLFIDGQFRLFLPPGYNAMMNMGVQISLQPPDFNSFG